MQQPAGQNDKPGSSFRTKFEKDTVSEPYSRLVFIDVSRPEAVRDRRKVRTARSHAVTVALARKRLEAQKKGENFRLQRFDADQSDLRSRQTPGMLVALAPSGPIGLSSMDPFETLPVNARRLTTLFHLRSSLCAGEPVFNMNDAIHYQSLHSIFESGFGDGALTAALSLTLSYAASGWQMTDESIKFSLVAAQHLRQSLSDPPFALSSAMVGTVILLLGNAYRLGELQSAKAHLHGLGMLIRLCSQRSFRLSHALKRAIYWQDLFSSMFLGTDRIVKYEEFYPNQQLQIEYSAEVLGTDPPLGFIESSHRLGSDLMSAASDVALLYSKRQQWHTSEAFKGTPEFLDNVQAHMEGRLHSLRQATVDDMLLCCIIALHLCVYGFWDDIWTSALIPKELTAKLLYHLSRCQQHDFVDEDLLLWLIYVGKAFAIDAEVRIRMDSLWFKHHCGTDPTLPQWDDAYSVLSKFIWSEVLYSERTGWFWERIRA